MGCCQSSPDEEDERRRLVQTQTVRSPSALQPQTVRSPSALQPQSVRSPSALQPQSVRSPCSAAKDTVQRTGRFTARHVGVPDLDQRFTDVAETFNKQQENYNNMKEKLQTIASRYNCQTNDSLSQSLERIKEEHDQHHISLEVKGYDFLLVVRPEAEIPEKLKRTQENIGELSKAAKAVISVGTKLNEMIDSLLKAKENMTKQIEDAESQHQERKRLEDNLKENIREAKRAKELSPKYKDEAGELLKEVARLSGITP
ncbi:uncharacterized protein si:ch73-345f18.3 isoform X2 [Xyrauchen texanus]|uniref:uncharacterized protein si:ch73-345f18.3 isoform X2 n=1 Tax=Xyrauchen texanus TaxID=154827 RepID=UPI002241DCD5|nr:uncharacterized protein si:ch73-345f18.3 isoform X2 [Xyrauchen texanus]